MFTDDPVNWLKWAVVFAILIGGYAVAVPLYKKVSHGMSWERKRDIAKSRDHVIKASLVDKHPTGEVSHYVGTLPTTTRSTVRSGSTPPISSIHRHRPCTCISTTSIIPISCFPVRSTTTKTTRGCSCSRSSFCPGSWPASPSSSWAWTCWDFERHVRLPDAQKRFVSFVIQTSFCNKQISPGGRWRRIGGRPLHRIYTDLTLPG